MSISIEIVKSSRIVGYKSRMSNTLHFFLSQKKKQKTKNRIALQLTTLLESGITFQELFTLGTKGGKIFPSGISLVVQWLRLHVPNVDGLGSVSGWGTRCHMSQVQVMYATARTWHSQIK